MSPLAALTRLLVLIVLIGGTWSSRADAAEPTPGRPVVVGDQGIARRSLDHWAGVLDSRAAAVRFLVHDRWLRGEVERHGLRAPRLRRSGSADARLRARAAAYTEALRAHAASPQAFTAAWTAWWQPQTRCAPAFFVADVCAAPGSPLKALTPRSRLSPSA